MRTIALTALIASAGFGFAGESPKQAIIPASIIPQSSDCADCLSHSGLFLGAGVDYVFETETAYYNARVGYEFAGSKDYSQSLFVEVGWTEDGGSDAFRALPITVNYEYKRALTKCLNFYIGGGAGVAFVDSNSTAPRLKPEDPRETINTDEAVFALQGFVGLTYCLTHNVELYGGVRYLWTDDADDGRGLSDWSIGGGLRVKF